MGNRTERVVECMQRAMRLSQWEGFWDAHCVPHLRMAWRSESISQMGTVRPTDLTG